MVLHDIWQCWWHQRSLEAGSGTWVLQKKNKDISILTETHINHDQIHHQIHIRNNWLGPIFFSPGDSHTKGLLVLLHLGLEGFTEVDTDPKGRFLSFKVTPSNDRVLCVCALGIVPGNSCLDGVSLKDYKIIWKIKMREMKTKQYLETLIVLWIKWTGNKARLDRCCSYYPLNMDNDLRIYGEGRTQIPLSSLAMIGPIKIANETKSNHIMVSFTNHYKVSSIDRLPSKTKIGIILFYTSQSSPPLQSSFKENAKILSKNSTT